MRTCTWTMPSAAITTPSRCSRPLDFARSRSVPGRSREATAEAQLGGGGEVRVGSEGTQGREMK